MSSQPSPPASPPAPSSAAAVKSRPGASSPEALDDIITTTNAHGWWALWALTAAVVAALVWSCVATIPTQVTATGVIPTPIYATAITSPAEGKLTLNLAFGGAITEGEVLGTVQPFDGSAAVDITAPTDGSINGIFVDQGDTVQLGTKVEEFVAPPDPSQGVRVVTYLPALSAVKFAKGDKVQVTVFDVATATSVSVDAAVSGVATVPASLEDMETLSGSSALAQQWFEESGGSPYRIFLDIQEWPSDDKTLTPASGQIVEITNTYGSQHPIQLLFGGR